MKKTQMRSIKEIRKEARKLTPKQLRAYYATLHSKAGIKAINVQYRLAKSHYRAPDLRRILKEEMNRRKSK